MDINLLIVKVSTGYHELAHSILFNIILGQLPAMGIPHLSLVNCLGTKYKVSGSSKEGDSAYKPESRPRLAD